MCIKNNIPQCCDTRIINKMFSNIMRYQANFPFVKFNTLFVKKLQKNKIRYLSLLLNYS